MSAWGEKVKDAWWAVRRNRRAKIISGCIAGLVVVLGTLYGALGYYGKSSGILPGSSDINFKPPVERVKVLEFAPRRIDGVEVAWADSNVLPVSVMIENLASIRTQQYGLGQANLVYEVLAEGGITRFLAVYAQRDPISKLGPIRSARHYCVDWAEEYGGVYMYVGGSPQALGVTNTTAYLTDLNQFYHANYYYRDPELFAPHNLFSNSELITFALRDLELSETIGEYEAYLFKEDKPKSDRPAAADPIMIDWSTSDYEVEWRYDRETNTYWRWNGGEEHYDANSNEQLSAHNIVIQRVKTSVLDAATGRLDVVTIGEGDAIVLQDGLAITGRWKKSQRGERTTFVTVDDEDIAFNPGTTWIEAVPIDTAITY